MSEVFRRNHERLELWNAAMNLADAVYDCIRCFPVEERFNLSDQMRRAACSIPSNIAEGAAKETTRENLRALYHARGSLAELETQAELARRRGYDVSSMINHVAQVSRLLSGYIRYLKRKLK
ncbi:MAG: four helix bundle protein [Bacteroidetes bacterium]|nr:four helix bundle protein [Bacteroidota bacterium]